MKKSVLLLIALFSMGIQYYSYAQKNLDVEGDGIVRNNLGIGVPGSGIQDRLEIYKEGIVNFGLTLSNQYTLAGQTYNTKGRLSLGPFSNRLYLGMYNNPVTDAHLEIDTDFFRLDGGDAYFAPKDACTANGDQVLQVVIDRGAGACILANPNDGEEKNESMSCMNCDIDFIHLYPESPSSGSFYSYLGTVSNPWTNLNANYISTFSISTSSIKFANGSMSSAVNAFQHETTAANSTGNFTTIDHPLTNGKPDAILVVTQNYIGLHHNEVVGVNYFNGKWLIFNQNQSVSMPAGLEFNVMVTDL